MNNKNILDKTTGIYNGIEFVADFCVAVINFEDLVPGRRIDDDIAFIGRNNVILGGFQERNILDDALPADLKNFR